MEDSSCQWVRGRGRFLETDPIVIPGPGTSKDYGRGSVPLLRGDTRDGAQVGVPSDGPWRTWGGATREIGRGSAVVGRSGWFNLSSASSRSIGAITRIE